MTESILIKFKEQKIFIRYLDGNRENCTEDNCVIVKLQDAMKNIEWVVDWDINLTFEEIQVVNNITWRNKWFK